MREASIGVNSKSARSCALAWKVSGSDVPADATEDEERVDFVGRRMSGQAYQADDRAS